MRSLKSALHAIAGMVYSVQGVVGDGDIAGVVATQPRHSKVWGSRSAGRGRLPASYIRTDGVVDTQ